jgi:hypothetical protein
MFRERVVGSAVQQAASFAFLNPTPLLEEKRYIRRSTLSAN